MKPRARKTLRTSAPLLLSLLLLTRCNPSNSLTGSVSEIFPLDFNNVVLWCSPDAFQVTYYYSQFGNEDIVIQLDVQLGGLSFLPGQTFDLSDSVAPGQPRATVTHTSHAEPTLVFPLIQRGSLTLDSGGLPGERTTGTFSLSFIDDSSVGALRTVSGGFDDTCSMGAFPPDASYTPDAGPDAGVDAGPTSGTTTGGRTSAGATSTSGTTAAASSTASSSAASSAGSTSGGSTTTAGSSSAGSSSAGSTTAAASTTGASTAGSSSAGSSTAAASSAGSTSAGSSTTAGAASSTTAGSSSGSTTGASTSTAGGTGTTGGSGTTGSGNTTGGTSGGTCSLATCPAPGLCNAAGTSCCGAGAGAVVDGGTCATDCDCLHLACMGVQCL